MDLNLSKYVMELMFWGRLFHKFGAIISKALSPNVLDFTRISEIRFFDCERRLRLGLILLTKFTEISRGISMKAFKNKSEDFKLNTSPYRQPVETTEDQSYVFKFPFACHKPCC